MSNCLEKLFKKLNKNCTYLVMRNWDNIFDEDIYSNGHEDIDILCNSLIDFVSLTGAKRVHKEKKRDNYIVYVDNLSIRFDVRWVGDGYYPEEWEKRMLERRELNEQSIYVMSKEDYFFSLSYHALLQKPKLSNEYLFKINEVYNRIEGKEMEITEKDILYFLNKYLREFNFRVEVPNDPGVFQNRNNICGLPRRNNIKRKIRRIIFLSKYRLKNLV